MHKFVKADDNYYPLIEVIRVTVYDNCLDIKIRDCNMNIYSKISEQDFIEFLYNNAPILVLK